MKEFHRRDFANRTGLAQAWTVKVLTDFSHGSGALRGIRLKLWFEKDTKWKPVDRLDQLRALVLCLKLR